MLLVPRGHLVRGPGYTGTPFHTGGVGGLHEVRGGIFLGSGATLQIRTADKAGDVSGTCVWA